MKTIFAALLILCVATCAAQEKFTYGPGKNQWGNLYQAQAKNSSGNNNNAKPTPVYIWSHPNSDGKTPPSANNIPKGMVDNCNAAGVSVISWESVPQVKTLDDVKTCRADLDKVYEWLVANAEKYNLDLNNLFIGGASRGTVVSWDFVCKHPEKIRGAYLTQALPQGAWALDTENPLTPMTAKNPPVVLSYRGGIGTKDGHDPKYGQRVVDKYKELGIADRATLLMNQKNQYAQLIEFINKHRQAQKTLNTLKQTPAKTVIPADCVDHNRP